MRCGQRQWQHMAGEWTWAARGWPDPGQHRREPSADAGAASPAPDERIGDAEREHSAALVSRAYVDGLLRADELDEHLGRVYAAVTVADLEAATAVLPRSWRQEVARAERDASRARARQAGRRRELVAYAAVMVLLVGVWAVTALSAGAWHPWPLYPALGWGLPLLLSGARRGRGGDRPRALAAGSDPRVGIGG